MSGDAQKTDYGVPSAEMIESAAGRPQSQDRKARLGFIGAGWWATTNHMPILRARKDVEFVCVCRRDQELARRIQQDFGFAHTAADHRDLLAHDLDGVVVSTPHPLHAEHAKAALEAGCHVLVEKPMTTRAEDARELVRIAQAKGLHLVVSYGWHYRPLSVRAKQLMDEGLVGQIEHVECFMGSPGKNLFSGTSFDHPEDAYLPPDLATYADPETSEGGFGQGQLSHAVGLLIWLTGLQAESVFARMSNVGFPVDMYDALTVRFKGGAIGSVSGAVTVPAGGRFQLDLRIFGSEGVLLFDIDRERLDVYRHDGNHRILEVSRDDGAYRCDGPPHEFVELILGLTDRNSAPGGVGMRAVEIIDAAYRSHERGKEIRIQ